MSTAEAGLTKLHPSELHESPDNPRTITGERFEALKHSMKQDPGMMEARPLIATLDGEVVAGNMRLRAAKELGWTEVPTVLAPLDEKRKREWMLRDNNGYGEWDQDALTDLVAEYAQGEGADTSLLGFGQDDLDRILKENSGGGDAPPEPALPEMWGIVVECESEEQQSDLLERLDGEGFNVRALL